METFDTTPITGTKRVRCNRIECANPLNQVPSVRFSYETVTTLSDGREIIEGSGDITIPYDPQRNIYLVDPASLAFLPLPVTDWQTVFLALFSASINELGWASNDPSMADKVQTP